MGSFAKEECLTYYLFYLGRFISLKLCLKWSVVFTVCKGLSLKCTEMPFLTKFCIKRFVQTQLEELFLNYLYIIFILLLQLKFSILLSKEYILQPNSDVLNIVQKRVLCLAKQLIYLTIVYMFNNNPSELEARLALFQIANFLNDAFSITNLTSKQTSLESKTHRTHTVQK